MSTKVNTTGLAATPAGLILLGWLILLGVQPAPGQKPVPTCDEIPDRYKWDLSLMYTDLSAWEADFARAEQWIARLQAERNAGLDSPAALLACLDLRFDTRWLVDKLLVYASQLSDQDTRDNSALALKNRATGLYVRFARAAAWIEPAIAGLPEDTLRAWCESTPGLRTYRHYLANVLRSRPHLLPAREEELLAMSGNLAALPEEAYSALTNAELPWPMVRDQAGQEVRLSSARFDKFIRSPDRRLRRDAFLGAMGAYAAFQNTLAATLAGALHRHVFYAQARGFESPLESVLFPDALPVSMYENLVRTVRAHRPLLRRWAALRRQALDLDQLHVYDLYVPLAADPDQSEIAYDDAVTQIIASLEPLGPDYVEVVTRAFSSRWVDVYETQGKRTGGYSWGSYDSPPYILVNYNGSPRDMSILTHELGHSMHSYLTHRHQPKVYGDYSGLVAEVASIFHEILLEEYRLAQARTPRQRLPLLNQQIDNLQGTVFRQVLFAEFEYQAHSWAQQGQPVTAERLGQLYLDTFHDYWGGEVARDPENAVYWARVPHFYMNHYVFRYAAAYCAAAALAENVLAGRPGAREAYLELLAAGSSDYPLELLSRAGVDLTTPTPIEAAMRRFERLVDEFHNCLSQAAEQQADTAAGR